MRPIACCVCETCGRATLGMRCCAPRGGGGGERSRPSTTRMAHPSLHWGEAVQRVTCAVRVWPEVAQDLDISPEPAKSRKCASLPCELQMMPAFLGLRCLGCTIRQGFDLVELCCGLVSSNAMPVDLGVLGSKFAPKTPKSTAQCASFARNSPPRLITGQLSYNCRFPESRQDHPE